MGVCINIFIGGVLMWVGLINRLKSNLSFVKKYIVHLVCIVCYIFLVVSLGSFLLRYVGFSDNTIKYKPELKLIKQANDLGLLVTIENKTDKIFDNLALKVNTPFGYRIVDGKSIILIDTLEPGEVKDISFELEKGIDVQEEDMRTFNFNSVMFILFVLWCLICYLLFKYRHKSLLKIIVLLGLCIFVRCLVMLRNPLYVGVVDDRISVAALSTADVELYYTLKSDSNFIDSNQNGVPDCIEKCDMLTDSDGDGLSDYEELSFTNTSPFSPYSTDIAGDCLLDSDGDGLVNSVELMFGSNTLVCDTDGDGLSDYEEYKLHTCPYKVDTDGDKMSDFFEVEQGLNPASYTIHAKAKYTVVDEENGLNVSVEASGSGDALARFKIKPIENNVNLSEDVPGYLGKAYEFGWEPENAFAFYEDSYNYAGYFLDLDMKNMPAKEYYTDLLYKHNKDDYIFFDAPQTEYINHRSFAYRFHNFLGFDVYLGEELKRAEKLNKYHEVNVKVRSNDDIKRLYDYGTFDYQFSSDAMLTFEFDESLWEREGFEPCIYYYDTDTQLLDEVETVVEGNKASAEVNHFSSYILLDKGSRETVKELFPYGAATCNGVAVLMLLDTSKSTHLLDIHNNRLSFIKNYINKGLDRDTDYLAVTNFTGSGENIVKFTHDFDYVIQQAEGVLTGEEEKYNSDYYRAVYDAIDMFDDVEDSQKFIILITDGFKMPYDNIMKDTIDKAQKNDVIVYAIDIGDGYDSDDLMSLAYGTGGGYNHISDMFIDSQLEYISDLVSNSTYNKDKDSNEDGLSDYYTMLINSGRLTTGTGLDFYGKFVDNSADIDGDTLLNGDEIEVIETDKGLYLKVYSNPFMKDSDNDGIDDDKDYSPFEKGLVGEIVGRLHIVSSISEDPGFLDFGHSFLVYENYVKDTWEETKDYKYWGIDIWPLKGNLLNNTRGVVMDVNPGEYITIGNYSSNATDAALKSVYKNLTGDEGGISLNTELAYKERYFATEREEAEYNERKENRKLTEVDDRLEDVDIVAKKLASISFFITERGRHNLFNYLQSHNYYNLYTNNCVNVATGGLDAAFKGTCLREFSYDNDNRYLSFVKTYGRSKQRLVHYAKPADLYEDLSESEGRVVRDKLSKYIYTTVGSWLCDLDI